MATNVSEKEARDVVEAAREAEWKLPSFGKQLFLGDFRLDLIHPQPKLDPEQIDRGERFLTELREVLAWEADPLEIEREAKIPDNVLDALKRIGALGMKVPPKYGGLGLSQVYYKYAAELLGGLTSWMARKGFQSVDEVRGMLSVPAVADKAAYERAGYVTAMRAANAGAYNPW
jgi:alkylation response protein AidB-like acyl-CoA dehydrogenase